MVGAGSFGSAEDALTEWRDAVGMTAADARLSPCPGELAAWLLGPSARSGLLGDMLVGGEHLELVREYFGWAGGIEGGLVQDRAQLALIRPITCIPAGSVRA